ncbi:hypothetical protein RS130_18830 [Paraglaciecola aquimarina]|uniref:TPR repeat-containing protein n=1 Tax=Paraglaciecola aquimarina TaxID=1235557 RepID=A0ABU3T073_9ALTE|nr:tetratricopeptide repeat protein [Paraglaciecola aquimarina]MDU0355661.1 hypothetical protein [Paraglaciecola aquimarina]
MLYYQGMLNLADEQLSAATQAFEQAINLDPTNGDALLALAKLVTQQKQFVHAELLYQRAERIKSLQLPAMLGRAQVYIDQQDFAQALQLLRQTAKAFPKHHGLESNIRSLSQIVNNQS